MACSCRRQFRRDAYWGSSGTRHGCGVLLKAVGVFLWWFPKEIQAWAPPIGGRLFCTTRFSYLDGHTPSALAGKAKAVEQVALDSGEVLARFPSITQAARDMNVTQNGIRRVLCGKQKSCAGHSWRLANNGFVVVPTKQHKRADECFCYLLESRNPQHPNRTYIGVTIDPTRRIAQHNRVKKGGAKRTAAARPWEFKLLITGFPDYNTGLRFEYAWQRFDKYKMLRNVIGDKIARRMKRKRGLQGQLAMLKTLLLACPRLFGDCRLRLHFMDAKDLEIFEAIEVPDSPFGRLLTDPAVCVVSTRVPHAVPFGGDSADR